MSAPLSHSKCVLAAIAVAIGVNGCDRALHLEEYAVSSTDTDAGGLASMIPARPDDAPGRRRNCAQCVADRCRSQRDACLASERCQALLRCMAPGGDTPDGCGDPNCIARCHDTLLPSPYFEAFFACAFTNGERPTPNQPECANECGAGDNWACLEDYRWDVRGNHPSFIDVHVYDWAAGNSGDGVTLAPFQFVELAACADGYASDSPRGEDGCGANWIAVDAYGGATLSFEEQGAIAIRSVLPGAEFPEPGQVGLQRFYPRPLRRSGALLLPLINFSSLLLVTDGLQRNPELGVLQVYQVDCLNTAATTNISIAGRQADTQLTGRGTSDQRAEFSAYSIFVNVPPDQALEVSSTLHDGRTASRRTVLVAPRWFTEVVLYPLSRQ